MSIATSLHLGYILQFIKYFDKYQGSANYILWAKQET